MQRGHFFADRRLLAPLDRDVDWARWDDGRVRVAQWNTLADALSDAFPHCPEETKRWQHRFPLIVAEVLRFVRAGFVIALEEVDHFEDIRAAVCAGHQETGAAWHSKLGPDLDPRLGTPKDGDRDGVALFWDERCYKLASPAYHVALGDGMSQIALVAKFLHVGSGRPLVFAGVHLK